MQEIESEQSERENQQDIVAKEARQGCSLEPQAAEGGSECHLKGDLGDWPL